MRNRREAGAVIILLVGVALIGLPTIVLPPGRDQAIFGLAGRTMLDGGFPFRDVFDFKPPGIHVVYAIGAIFSGREIWGARALDLLSHLLGVVALFGLVRPRGLFPATLAATHLGLAYLTCFRYWDLGQPEGFLTTLVLWGLLLHREAGDRRGPRFAAGLAFGWAILMKYTAVLYLPLLLLIGTRTNASSGGHERRRPVEFIVLIVAIAIPPLMMLLYLALGGALGSFVEIQTRYLPGYSGLVTADGLGPAVSASAALARDFFLQRPFLLWPPVLGVIVLAASPGRPGRWIPAIGIALSVVAVAAQGKFFHYHWIPVLPFLAWAAGDGCSALVARGRNAVQRRTIGGAVALLLALTVVATALPRLGERGPATRHLLGTIDRDRFYAAGPFGTFGVGDHAASATLAAARRVEALCPPDGRVFVWGFEPALYLAADRRPASRFVYNAAFLSPWCPPGWREELIDTLRRSPPELFVVTSEDAIPWVTGIPMDSREALALMPEVLGLLRERYEPIERLEHFDFFQLIH